jgi:hypothetical protein
MPTCCCEDARVHYPVHKKQTHPSHPPHHAASRSRRATPIPEGTSQRYLPDG